MKTVQSMFGEGRNLLSGVSIGTESNTGSVASTAPGRNLVDAIVDRAHPRTEYPPSTGIAAPVMKSEAGLARKTAMPAGSPGAPSGRLCHVNFNWPREVSTTQFEFMRLSQLATSGKLLLGRRGACGGM